MITTLFLGDIRYVQYYLRLNEDGYWYIHVWHFRIKCSEGQTPILLQTCVLLYMGLS